MKVRLTPRALAELDGIFGYIAQENPKAAEAVIDRIERAIGMLSEHRDLGFATDTPGIRCLIVARYKYRIFYEVLK